MSETSITKKLMKIITRLFDTRAAGVYMLLFAISIGGATFIENDFGTSAAQKVVYQTSWFELLLVLFSLSALINIFRFKMIKQKKWALLIFHASIVVIMLGAGITRYFGYEGVMHIREGDASNSFLSSETYLQFNIFSGGNRFSIDEKVLFASLGRNKFEESYQLGNDVLNVKVKNIIPNPIQNLSEVFDGKPTIKIVFGGAGGREEYYLMEGNTSRIRNMLFNFSDEYDPQAFNIRYVNDSLYFKTNRTFTQTVMATQTQDTLYPVEDYYPLKLRSLYSDGLSGFVFGDFVEKAQVSTVSEKRKIDNASAIGINLEININGSKTETYIVGRKGVPGRPAFVGNEDFQMSVSYGAKPIQLPFSVKLYDFIMERYPGTNSAASYASEVQLNDPQNGTQMDYRIYMNHILNYGGYRFFQSSFDKDEKGTYLSVNHDFWGTWISYIGYALLTLGLLMTLVSKNTRFYQLSKKLTNMRASTAGITILLFALSTSLNAQQVVKSDIKAVSADHAEAFSELVVQDFRGRMKPLHTMNRELLRKVSGSESFEGLNADQTILSMFVNRQEWYGKPIIKIGQRTQELLEVRGKRAAYRDFFDKEGKYILSQDVSLAHNSDPKDRGKADKELIKVDERVNIMNMIFSGSIFKIIPLENDENNTWLSSQSHGNGNEHNETADLFFSNYTVTLAAAMNSGDYSIPNRLLTELSAYQKVAGSEVIPSDSKINSEIFLNKLNIFKHLSYSYVLLGLLFLILLFISVFLPRLNLKPVFYVLFTLTAIGFLFHTVGLGLRWYVSGRAPWSNGYESLIYIGWTTALAGLIFTRKSAGALAATMVLSGTILLIALLSFFDPEITPLQPVLRSYWLTIHVSLEAGSYGFLMLGAIIGIINLILMMLTTAKNKDRVVRVVREMSYISEMTLIGGLIMISIGTYLGGVWANESWGRYWGWDAKETWALVSILVYAFILHLRIIPKLQGLYTFNVWTLVGLASIIMTYFGVNYYLSGLHSYAAGDPVPIPAWVPVSVVCCIIICILAYWKKKKYHLKL